MLGALLFRRLQQVVQSRFLPQPALELILINLQSLPPLPALAWLLPRVLRAQVQTSSQGIALTEDGATVTGYLAVVGAGGSDVITLNGSTTGGFAGDFIEIIDIAAGQWQISKFVQIDRHSGYTFQSYVINNLGLPKNQAHFIRYKYANSYRYSAYQAIISE